MKLSDIKGERTLDVVAEIIEPIARIAADKKAAELFAPKKPPKGMTAKSFLIKRITSSLPALMKGHKKDIIAILAAVEGVTPEEYAASLNMAKLLVDFTEIANDEAFTTFFISAQSETSSGSAQENIAAPSA